MLKCHYVNALGRALRTRAVMVEGRADHDSSGNFIYRTMHYKYQSRDTDVWVALRCKQSLILQTPVCHCSLSVYVVNDYLHHLYFLLRQMFVPPHWNVQTEPRLTQRKHKQPTLEFRTPDFINRLENLFLFPLWATLNNQTCF